MSDFILKIFPVDEVNTDKTELLKENLMKVDFLSGDETEFSRETYLLFQTLLKAGNFNNPWIKLAKG